MPPSKKKSSPPQPREKEPPTKKTKKISLTPTTVIFKDISAIQTILAGYSSSRPTHRSNKVIELQNPDGDLPQTFIPGDDDVADRDIPITELLHEKSKRGFYFLDTRKTPNKFWGIMIDITANGPLPAAIKAPCWWCRHTFQTRPIGCPLRYNAHRITGVEKERFDEKAVAANIDSTTNDFFETEGCFCSFPCCKAFILDQRGSVKYKESAALLTLLFFKLFGVAPDFPCAPSWKILKEYGGHLSILEFRATFGKIEYLETVNTRRPYMYCSSQYISEKKIKMFRGAVRD